MKPISSSEFARTLEPVLRRSGAWSGDTDDERPLCDAFPTRALLYPLHYEAPRELFMALLTASAQHFTAPVYLSMIEWSGDGSPCDWLVTADDYEEYSDSRCFGLRNVLYAGDGSWVLVFTIESYGILGSTTQGFIDDVRAAAPTFFDTNALVAYFRAWLDREPYELGRSWLTNLLEHVYGRDEAKRLLS